MLERFNPVRVVFLDIETAAAAKSFEELPDFLKQQWIERVSWQLKEGETPAQKFENEAGLHSEFSRIVCAVVGKLVKVEEQFRLETKQMSGTEHEILTELAETFGKLPQDVAVCAFNGLAFDVPTIARRMVIAGIKIPEVLDLSDRKPWEARIIDPMGLWRFGQPRHFCKMDLMAGLFGIESSKTEIKGEDVSRIFWSEGVARILKYCEADVRVLAQIFLKMKGERADLV